MFKQILPSSLVQQAENGDFDYVKKLSSDFSLKMGVVIETIEITDEGNRTKVIPEYTVMVIEDDNTSIYDNCIAMESFGNAADFFTAKLRKTDKPQEVKSKGSATKQNGAVVLVLCLNGQSEQGIIIGSLSHPNKKTPLTKDAGHHMEGEYNGINWQVNNDGELTVTFKSASSFKNNDVEYQDNDAQGTFIKMDKTGSIDLNDNNGENIKIDKANQNIEVNAENNESHNIGKDFSLTSGANINLISSKDLIANISGQSDVSVEKDINFIIKNNFSCKASKVEFEAKSKYSIKCQQFSVEGSTGKLKVNNLVVQGSSVKINATSINLGSGGTPALTMHKI